MPKTVEKVETESTEVSRLREAIAETEELLRQKSQQLCKQEQATGDFCEALALIKNPPRYKPAPGELEPFDALERLLAEAQDEPDRLQRLSSAEASLELSRQAYNQIEQERQRLLCHLTRLKTELEWHENYETYAQKYRSAYPFPPTPEESRANRLTDLEASIIGHQRRIAQAQEFIQLAQKKQRDPSIDLPAWNGIVNPEDAIENSTSAIAHLKASLEREKQQPLPDADPRVEADFRVFVRSRVAVEKQLHRFLAAQQQYNESLSDLREIVKENPTAFDYTQLPKQLQVLLEVDSNNKIVRIENSGK